MSNGLIKYVRGMPSNKELDQALASVLVVVVVLADGPYVNRTRELIGRHIDNWVAQNPEKRLMVANGILIQIIPAQAMHTAFSDTFRSTEFLAGPRVRNMFLSEHTVTGRIPRKNSLMEGLENG